MAKIPDNIGGVQIELAEGVGNDVTDEMLEALRAAISKTSVAGYTIDQLWVSSARDSHICPSRHVTGNAVDISRVNGKYISVSYEHDDAIRAIVDGLQKKFESAPHRRENFGPTIQKKLGEDYPVTGHKDHFHWSVNGDHSQCTKRNIFRKFLDRFRSPVAEDEICQI